MSGNQRGRKRTMESSEKAFNDALQKKIKADEELHKRAEELWDNYEKAKTQTESELRKQKEEFFAIINGEKSNSEAFQLKYAKALQFTKTALEKVTENLNPSPRPGPARRPD